jgi:hypothetical protein
MQQIGEAAGVARSTPAYFFGSKEAPYVGALLDFLSHDQNFLRLIQREALGGGRRVAEFFGRSVDEAVAALGPAAEKAGITPERLVLDLAALCWYPFAHEHTLLPALGMKARDPALLDQQKRHLGDLVRAMTRPGASGGRGVSIPDEFAPRTLPPPAPVLLLVLARRRRTGRSSRPGSVEGCLQRTSLFELNMEVAEREEGEFHKTRSSSKNRRKGRSHALFYAVIEATEEAIVTVVEQLDRAEAEFGAEMEYGQRMNVVVSGDRPIALLSAETMTGRGGTTVLFARHVDVDAELERLSCSRSRPATVG